MGRRVWVGSSICGVRDRHAAGCSWTGLGEQGDAKGLHHEDAADHEIDQSCWRGQPLHGERRDQHAAPGAQTGCRGIGNRAACWVEIEHAGPDGSDGGARSQTLDDAGHEEGHEAVGVDEDGQRQELASDTGEENGPSADVIGKASQGQQCTEKRQRVDAENDRDGQIREAPLVLIRAVERSRRGRGGQERHGDRGQEDHTERRPARRWFGRRDRFGHGGFSENEHPTHTAVRPPSTATVAPCYVTRPFGSEKGDDFRDLLGLGSPSEQRGLGDLFDERGFVGRAEHRSRRDGVDSNAAGTEFQRPKNESWNSGRPWSHRTQHHRATRSDRPCWRD